MPARDRYKKRRSNRRTYSFHLSEPAVTALNALVERGAFENRSHAVDEAIALLLRVYRDPEPLRDPEAVNAA